ncbi:MAG TPA: MBOAT family O-acyltransferase [Opitutales bacterium]|nr:MBOAT family O-acyltransferase [Opitutales bacterium]
MNFISLTYLILLATVFALYWTFPTKRAQNLVLLIASYLFYGWWDWRFLGLILLSSTTDYALGLAIYSSPAGHRRRQVFVGLSLAFNLGILGFFKYFNFFEHSFAAMAHRVGLPVGELTLDVILPVGVSFYTFQSLSYIFDVNRGRLTPTRNLLDFLAYVSFFPQLVAGPIERAERLLPQFQKARVFDYDEACAGCREMLWGLVKKAWLADNFGYYVRQVYGDVPHASGGQLLLGTFFFGLQVYCDFSGYSHIAIGSARLLGVSLMRNFAFPYFATSPTDFWHRWHISLSTWFRDYLYFPLGGSRGTRARTCANIFVVFLISGLWHGAAWTFVIWGCLHGLLLISRELVRKKGAPPAVPSAEDSPWLPSWAFLWRLAGTFLAVNFCWIFFRAASLDDALLVIQRIATWAPGSGMRPWQPGRLMVFGVLLLAAEWTWRRYVHPLAAIRWPLPLRYALYTILLWACVVYSPPEPSTFIYFAF